MKEYISLKIELNVLVFDYKTITKEQKTLVNKNSFIEDSLLYDFKYFKKNINKIVELIKRDFPDVNLIKVKRLVTFKYVADIIKLLNIQCLILDFFSTVAMSDYELFLSCECLREVRCYFMSSDVMHLFNEKNIEVHMSSEVKITDKFLELHDTDSKDSLYYKKVITINEEYPELMSDLKEFLKINYKLRAINVCVYSKELIESIVNLVSNDESREVIVYLHQEYDKGNFIVNNFEWLRELSDKCKEDFTCEFRIIYSDSFVSKNLFKQLTFNNLKLVFIFGMYIASNPISSKFTKYLVGGGVLPLMVCVVLRITGITGHGRVIYLILLLALPMLCVIASILAQWLKCIKLDGVVEYFGKTSLELYLWHGFIFLNFSTNEMFAGLHVWIQFVAAVSISLLLAHLTYILKRQIPPIFK
mgnify:CR=1 FL=1